MPLEKGTCFIHAHSFVLARYGGAGWTRVEQALSPAERRDLEAILAVGWYDLGLELHLFHSIDAVLGQDDGRLLEELGRYEAEEDLTRIHRLFLRLANPAYVLEKAGEYWSRFHDTGTWRVERLGPRQVRGTLRGFARDEKYCAYLQAYIRRMFELAGARGVTVSHPHCAARGDAACVHAGAWASE
jgi:hypothetical protein